MHKEIVVIGTSSQKKIKIKIKELDLELSLMDFLRNNGVPIASSCSGEGVCKKCVVSDSILSCGLTVRDYLNKTDQAVKVSYF